MTKYALITGGNRGIGLEIARQLGRKGFQILLGSRNREKGKIAVQQLERQDIRASMLPIDVSEEESFLRAGEQASHITERLDVLINNAGILIDQHDTLLSAPVKTGRFFRDKKEIGW